MKKILLINFFILLSAISFSQTGINASFLSSDFSNVESDILPDSKVDIFNAGIMTGLFYSIRVNGKGIVLLPDIGYSFFDSKIDDKKYKLQQISVGIPVKFYPFNLEGDCGCPDFSLRNKFFEKHFFLMLNNAVFYNFKSLTYGDKQYRDDYFSFIAGIGGGLTVPVSETVILEPFISYNFGFNDKWSPEMLYGMRTDPKTIGFNEVEFGVRIGMRN